jgi:hypothetical protein
MVELLCTHVWKHKNKSFETVFKKVVEEVNENNGWGEFNYNILRAFCKCHNVPVVQQ